MNFSELKQDFYKRYLASDNFLYFTSNGILCTLLGCTETEFTPSLNCTLSMGVKMFSRRLNGDFIHIQKNTSNQALHYILGSDTKQYRGNALECAELLRRLEPYGLRGGQVLFEYSAPDFIPRREVFFITLIQSLAKVGNIGVEPLQLASLASYGDNIKKYLGIIYSKKGYCTLVSSGEPKNLPLPFSGYKVLSIHCNRRDRSRAKQIRYAFEHVRRLFPHIAEIGDVTPEMLTAAAPRIRSRQALDFICHLVAENERIEKASAGLKKCDTDELFRQMNLSQASMERYWRLDAEHIFLAECCKPLEGVKAVRVWSDGVLAIVENDAVDNVAGIVRNEFENNIGYPPSFCVSNAV